MRYIDAEKLCSEILEEYGISTGGDDVTEIYGMIINQPTADVRENVKANLVIAGYKRNGSTQWFECSICGGAVDFTDNFCKHCGAYFRRGTT